MDALEDGSLVQVLPEIDQGLEISLVYPGKKNFSPKLDSFVEFLLESFEKDVPWEIDRNPFGS